MNHEAIIPSRVPVLIQSRNLLMMPSAARKEA